ncbi:MAG: hypothetical protein IPH20_06820 [Bacteroidales bacterium]|nr:hypothetical protein [Bacteroidales bacterium]
MLKFGGTPSVIYSDMNGFGPYVKSVTLFNLYWVLAGLIIALITFSFYLRGKEYNFVHRLKSSRNTMWKNRMAVSALLVIFITCGSFVYYNTKILNTYDSPEESENKQMEYEKAYKKYEDIAQPRFYKINYTINLKPEDRSMTAVVEAWARNTTEKPVNELHFTMPALIDSTNIIINGSKVKLLDNRLQYRIYSLNKELLPNDSILIKVEIRKLTKGFENEVSFTQLTQKGTFFNNTDICLHLVIITGWK